MKNRGSIALAVLAGIFFTAPLAAQAEDGRYYERRCEGSINKALGIVMYLQRDGGDVRGFYYYTTRREILLLRGTAGTTDELVLSEFPRTVNHWDEKNRTGIFRGTWSSAGGAARFSGTWSSPDGRKTFPFTVTEKYGADAVSLRTVRLDRTAPLVPGRNNTPKAEMHLSLLYPDRFGDNRVLAALRRAFADPFPDDPQKTLQSYADKFVDDYRASYGGEADLNDSPMYQWEYSSSQYIVLNDGGLLCAGMSVHMFTGGAHGNTTDDFISIDLQTGRRLTTDDIFRPELRPELEKLVRAQAREYVRALLRDNEGAEPDEEDVASAFFDENFELTDNVYLAVDGLGFYFNPYEITPYVFGPIDAFLTWEKITPLLTPDSPVRRVVPGE